MKPTQIILHCSDTADSGTVSWGAIREYHKNVMKWKNIGYHCGIENVNGYYEILLGRMLNEVGAHCKGHNSDSLGICFIGKFDITPPCLEQWETGINLVKWLMSIFNIRKEQVYGHREFNSGKTCPGTAFDLNKFRKELL